MTFFIAPHLSATTQGYPSFGKQCVRACVCVCVCVGVCVCDFMCVQLFATLWTVAFQAPLSTAFSRQEYWIGLPFPPPGALLDPGIEPASLMSPALAGWFFTSNTTW